MQQRTVEQIGRAPVPQIIVIPKDRFSWCASSGVCHKREYHFVWSRKLHLLFTRHHVCPEFSWHDISGRTMFGWCPSGIGVNVWSHCQLFGLESAHADGADEIDAPLDDVPSTGLWRLRHMLATFAGILEEHRTGGAARAMALTISWRRSGDNGKDGGCGMRGIESERERGSLAQLSTFTLGASMPCGAPRVPEQGSIELVSVALWCCYRRCCSSSMDV